MKGTSLTEDILTRTMPHPARRLSSEMEARAGEHKVALHDSESAKQFQALLKKPAKAANGKMAPTPGNMPGAAHAGQADEIVEPASVKTPFLRISVLFHHAEREVRGPRGLQCAEVFQVNRLCAQVIEEAHALT